MPAIQPVRLKKQALDLAAKSGDSDSFVRELRSLLDGYSDHTHRSGQAGEPFPLVSGYKVPPPVMSQVWVELLRQVKTYPDHVLPLCDRLWLEPSYDLQLLAARLLGLVSIDPPGPVLQRLQAWIQSGPDKRLLDQLLEQGLARFHSSAPTQVLELASEWMVSPELNLKQAGLRLLLPVIRQTGVQNLPAIYKMLTPYLRVAPMRLRPDILAVLTSLAHISPSETAYVLRQNLTAPDNQDTAWIIRQVMHEFPQETLAGLRSAMKEVAR